MADFNPMEAAWLITVWKPNGKNISYVSGTSIKGERILTCYHGFNKGYLKIDARRVNGFGVSHVAELVHGRNCWDLALLKLKRSHSSEFLHYLEISRNETLDVGDKVSVMDMFKRFYPEDEDEKFVKITDTVVTYPCVVVDRETFDGEAEHVPSQEECSLHRPYQVMCDVPLADFETYHPLLPLIYTNIFYIYPGLSGGSVFRPDKKIVGIVSHAGGGSFASAIHLSVIRQFLRECRRKEGSGLLE